MILFKNDFFVIEETDNQIFLRIIQAGAAVSDIVTVCIGLPRIKITKLTSIKEAIDVMSEKSVLIGLLKPMIEIYISKDLMSVHLLVNLNDNEKSASEVSESSRNILAENDITFGHQNDMLNNMPFRVKVLVAEGKIPIAGEDAILKYYELSEGKPLINDDGSVNHYDMQLIDNVVTGDSLGKKTPHTNGFNGLTVKNEEIESKVGRNLNFKYDQKTVRHMVYENETEELFAICDGAVCFKKNQVGIDNHLIIDGDVDYNTGNIEYDGYVTIQGTVKDKFIVIATKDIAINGAMGIGAVGKIESKEGSVSVKGGINGKGVAKIIAAHNILTKYSNEANLKAGNTIHIGLYSIDSEIKAKKIMLPIAGKIIGGNSYATHKIVTGFIGNRLEKPTKVYVEGFIREDVHDMMAFYEEKQKDLSKIVGKMKKELDIFERNMKKLDERGYNTYNFMVVKYEQQVTELKQVEVEMDRLNDILTTKGEGEILISNNVFPKTVLEMKNLQKRIIDKTTGTFFVEGREIFHNE